MTVEREPMTRAEGRRAGELFLAFIGHDDDRYDDLMRHTLAEYNTATMLDALVALWAGCVGWFDEDEDGLCRAAVRSYVDEPVGELDESVWIP
jgi:hypothetical protein